MFDMQKIGKKISSLRKEKGLTQMELADRMNISYQAVSNWERGNTMPDISKLPELAEIFGVSIEELLCDERKGKLVEEISEDKVPTAVTAEELSELAPILTQEQFKKTYRENKNQKADRKALALLAPFMDEKDLGQIAEEFLEKKGGELKELAALAPFMDEEKIEKIAKNFVEEKNGDAKELAPLAPFMDDAALSEIAKIIVERGGGPEQLVVLAPFMDEEALGHAAAEYLKREGNVSSLTALAPFLESSFLKELLFKRQK